jgi:hydroxymethylbilane synthase
MSAAAERVLRIGTRGSALAMWQANHVAERLRATARSMRIELVTIRTSGDLITDAPLSQIEGRAFFTKEIDDALLSRQIDLAVHSLKDLATALPRGIVLAAVPPREDPRDALVARAPNATLGTLPRDSRIGTASVRRRAFVAHHRPDLRVLPLRGNVPTRLAQLDDGHFDAVILAAAGLKRLCLEARITAYFDPQSFAPAVAQGALGLCVREDDDTARIAAAALEDRVARIETAAERAFLARLEAGCQVPAGALARCAGDRVSLSATVCEPDGSRWRSAALEGAAADAARLGCALADELREPRGAT